MRKCVKIEIQQGLLYEQQNSSTEHRETFYYKSRLVEEYHFCIGKLQLQVQDHLRQKEIFTKGYLLITRCLLIARPSHR